MNSEKKISVSSLKIDQKVFGEHFVLKEFEKKISLQSKPYYNLKLGDKSGEIKGKLWSENMKDVDADLKIGDIVKVFGVVQEYSGKPQIIVNEMKKAAGIAAEEFLPVTSRDRAQMLEVIEAEIETVANPHLKKLLNNFWEDRSLRDRFANFPAGEYVHHGYVGGLLEHVYEMLELSRPYIMLYPNMDKDLFFTGLFFHDIGKLEELDIVGATIVRNASGKLVAHIAQGLLMVDHMLMQIDDFPELLKTKLYHLILSHQGELEYGSPVKPQMLEALVLSYVDMSSAFMNQAVKHIEKYIETGEQFTDYHKWLGRTLWQGDFVGDKSL